MTSLSVTHNHRSGDATPDGWVGPEKPPPWPPLPRPLPTPADPAWRDPQTVWRIAVGVHVDPAAHDLAHPRPVWGCPGCPQSGVCPTCSRPSPECPDSTGHRRASAASELTWWEAA